MQIAGMRGGVDVDTEPQELSNKQMVSLHQVLHEANSWDYSDASDCTPFKMERMLCAGRLIAEMRGGVDEDTEPQELSNKQVVALHQLLHEAKFKDPAKDHLSPAGAAHPLSFACIAAPWA